MAGLKDEDIKSRLAMEFGSNDLSEYSDLIKERGLIGNVYIDASHFPRCAQKGDHKKFVSKFARKSLYVVAKNECANCVHANCGRCSVFQKTLTNKVPYDEKTLGHYIPTLAAEGRLPHGLKEFPKSSQEKREVLRVAFNYSPAPYKNDPIKTVRQQRKPVKPEFSDADVSDFLSRKTSSERMPGPFYLLAARRIMNEEISISSLSASSDPEVRKLAKDYGILGHTYIDVDAMGGAQRTLSFVQSKKLIPDFFLFRAANHDDRANEAYARLIKIAPIYSKKQPLDRSHFESALNRAVNDGRVSEAQREAAFSNLPKDYSNWASIIAQINLFKPISKPKIVDVQLAPKVSFHYGDPGKTLEADSIDPEQVRRKISSIMNTGASGLDLQRKILTVFSKADLRQVPEVGSSLAPFDGVQGSYFIDPTAYNDYGKGCTEGASKFKNKKVPYVLASSSCTGCIHHHCSMCSKYQKRLIRQVPEDVIRQASEIRNADVPRQTAPIANPVNEYELASELPIELNESKSDPLKIDISFPNIDND
jgi:hypothetical protein